MKERYPRGEASFGRAPRHPLDILHSIIFWCLILFLAGAVAGIAFAFRYHSNELTKAAQLGCLIHNGVTYELRQR